MDNKPPEIVGRRDILKTIGKGGFLLTAGKLVGDEVSHEVDLSKDGEFHAHGAVWRPIYENWHGNHESVLRSANLRGLNAVAFESKVDELFTCEANALIRATGSGHNSTFRVIPDDVLENLAENRADLIFGDLHVPSGSMPNAERTVAGVATFLGHLLSKKTSRRNFLLGTSLALTVPIYTDIASGIVQRNLSENQVLLTRALGRVRSISSGLQPEKLNDLFREVTQASKLLTWVESQKVIDQSPKLGYSWQTSHRGIEDWIRLGSEVCNSVILAYPDQVLSEVVNENNNDPRCLYASRLINLNKDELGHVVVGSEKLVENSKLKSALEKRGLIG